MASFDLSAYSAIPRWQSFIAQHTEALPPLLSEADCDAAGHFASMWTRWRWRRVGRFPEPVVLSAKKNVYPRDSLVAWMIANIIAAEAKAERRLAARRAAMPPKAAA